MRLAHATYVLTTGEKSVSMGPDLNFLLSPLAHWPYALLLLVSAAMVPTMIIMLPRVPIVADRLRLMRGKLRSYHDAIPWMLRLALGLALIGGGAEHFLLAPTVGISQGLALSEAFLGFLLICGLFTTPAAIACVGLYIFGTAQHPELIGNAEFLTASLALLAFSHHKPSLDDLIGLPAIKSNEQSRALVPVLLRIGIGTSMLWLAFSEKILNPHLFAEVVTKYDLTQLIPLDPAMWTLGVGLTEAVLGLAILLGIHTRLAAAISCITLVATFLYFGEHVAAHVTLLGVLAVLFITGNGPYSIGSWYAKYKLA